MGQISLGDFIVSSGKICVFPLLDACIRMVPGVLNKEQSYTNESFFFIEGCKGILENPIYTKPREWKGRSVPEVLLSGHHERVSKWKLDQAFEMTFSMRKDLINKYNYSYDEKLITHNTTRTDKKINRK